MVQSVCAGNFDWSRDQAESETKKYLVQNGDDPRLARAFVSPPHSILVSLPYSARRELSVKVSGFSPVFPVPGEDPVAYGESRRAKIVVGARAGRAVWAVGLGRAVSC